MEMGGHNGGRRRLPDAIKALKGNPGKRKLLLTGAGNAVAFAAKPAAIEVPRFLTADREREIFRSAIDLVRWVVHAPDIIGLARWAVYLDMWISAKEHFTEFRTLRDLEKLLQSLEDRIGLNPAARQRIVSGLASAAFSGELPEEAANSPVGFLARVRVKPN
jgi:hypothetical protein